MALFKAVNGELIAMTPEEEAEHNARQHPIPQAVTRAQLKLALLAEGRLDDAGTAIQAAARPRKIEWAERDNFRRNAPVIADLAAALSLNDAQVDDLFRLAATL